MFCVDVLIQVADPFRPRLKIINLHVVVWKQRFGQRFFLLQMVFHLPLRVKLIPVRGGIRREEENKLCVGVLLDERQKVVLHVELGLLGKPRFGVDLLDRIPAEGNVRQHGFPAVGIQIAPAVHRVELIRVALPQRGEAFGNVGQQHAFVEPIGNVVEEIVVVEIIRHFALGRLVKIGQRFHVHAVEHAAHVVRREGHIHHLLMVKGGTRVDAKLDKLPAEKAV